jgi:hypothetical protein
MLASMILKVMSLMSKKGRRQAQTVGPLMRRTKDRMNLKLLKEIDVKIGYPSNIITGCIILDNGKVLFTEYNEGNYIGRVTLNDSNGNFICTFQALNTYIGSFYDITSIDTNTVAVSIGACISIVNIDSQNIVHTIQNGCFCYGITHCDGKLYYCSDL